MKIKDIKNINKNFIICINKKICEDKGIDVRQIGGNTFPNHCCKWWQELKNAHEISINKYWAKNFISKYNLTDNDINIYFHKNVKIKVEIGKCRCCGRGKKKYMQVEVERICPYTKRARTSDGGWYDSCDYEIIPIRETKYKGYTVINK